MNRLNSRLCDDIVSAHSASDDSQETETQDLNIFQRIWRAIVAELRREELDLRTVAIALIAGVLCSAILLPFMLT